MNIISNHIFSQANQVISNAKDHIGKVVLGVTTTFNELPILLRNQRRVLSNSKEANYLKNML